MDDDIEFQRSSTDSLLLKSRRLPKILFGFPFETKDSRSLLEGLANL